MVPVRDTKIILIPFEVGIMPLLGVGAPPAVAAAGDDVLVNGVATTDSNFNDTTPVAGAGRDLLLWQRSGSGPDSISLQTSAAVPVVLSREMTDIAVVNSTTETDIFNFSVPANAMSTNRMLYLQILLHFLKNDAASITFTVRLYFGGTVIFADDQVFAGSSANTHGLSLNYYIGNQGATNDQSGGGYALRRVLVNPTTGIAGDVSSALIAGGPLVPADGVIDTTAAATLRATLQMSVASATADFTRKMAILTLN